MKIKNRKTRENDLMVSLMNELTDRTAELSYLRQAFLEAKRHLFFYSGNNPKTSHGAILEDAGKRAQKWLKRWNGLFYKTPKEYSET